MQRMTYIAAALVTSALMGIGGAASAQVRIITEVAPPAPRHEPMPGARSGYVWQQGHWEWRGSQYVWVPGQWLTARSGHQYDQPRWVSRNGEWQYVSGNWRRGPHGDRDGDGIANRHDIDRNGDGLVDRGRGRGNRMGPYGDLDRDGIENRVDRDIDGDGVINRRDAFPYDRRRS